MNKRDMKTTSPRVYREHWRMTDGHLSVSAWPTGAVEPRVTLHANDTGPDGLPVVGDSAEEMSYALHQKLDKAYPQGAIPDWWKEALDAIQAFNLLQPAVHLSGELWNEETGLPTLRAECRSRYAEPAEAIMDFEPPHKLGAAERHWMGITGGGRSQWRERSVYYALGQLVGRVMAQQARRDDIQY